MSRAIHEHLIEDQRDTVTVLRVDREDRYGALSRSMLEVLTGYLAGIAADPGVRVLVVTGTGKGFIAGADIGEYENVSYDAFVAYQRLGRAVFERIATLPQPVIAAINGYALGGGMELALCCDLRYAAPKAKLGLPEIRLGLLPGGSGTQRLSRMVGVSQAFDLITSGRSLTAPEAYAAGLLDAFPDPDRDVLDVAVTRAGDLAEAAPAAVRAAKELLRTGVELPLSAAWTLEQAVLAELYMSPDGQEGIRAFIDKREPQFGT